MPLTEIDVTSAKPIYQNFWTERDARRAAMPPPPPWPAVDPGLLEEGRPRLPAFPLTVFPAYWREWVKDAAHWAGSPKSKGVRLPAKTSARSSSHLSAVRYV